ncbi:hypothetical protein ILUMI_19954 [Ignelater luminosus]|uniref:Lipase domain-containing protein n=1 Tax=Ignelater luminosus TaxID=2038154 RepID=A0A8K0CH82_IGNLU|nr:hypothetical protein ILUMI_19954 [Ignelater luminosus]
MIRYLCTATLLTTVFCQQFPPDIKDDIFNIISNTSVILKECSGTVVSPSELTFTLFNQENPENGIVLDHTNLQQVKPENRLILIIHGWLQSASQSWIIQMKDVYLNQTAANIIVVDWSRSAGINYASSVCAVPQVGSYVADLIFNITSDNAAQLNNTQINGFSLGAHVAGIAGQDIQTKTNGHKIGRINGLEAAGPGFVGRPANKRLDKKDAWFVQAIHTNNWQFGYGLSYATVDFQVNKLLLNCGAFQRGCPFFSGVPKSISNDILEGLLPHIFCNHIRAAVYFIESINSGNFIGVSCKSCFRFGLGLCKSSPTAVMGENCPSDVSGDYYLSTNARTPLARGD